MMICAGIFIVLSGCSGEDERVLQPRDNVPEIDSSAVWTIRIEKIDNALMGHYTTVAVIMDTAQAVIEGFDFTIGYDLPALIFIEAELGSELAGCGWEYFTYRHLLPYDCDQGCPSGMLRVVGVAEINNGAAHPDFDCIGNVAGAPIVTLTFLISNDRTLECTFQPIRFFWLDCQDNCVYAGIGDTLGVNRRIIDIDGSRIEDHDCVLPGYFGVPDDSCMEGGGVIPVRGVDFINGGIQIICYGPIDIRGDVNVNGLAYEIADAVLFSNYFLHGLGVFDDHVDASIAASDANANGVTLEVGDLVYLIRVIVGDAMPYPDLQPVPDVTVGLSMKKGRVSVNTPVDIGAILLVFNLGGEIGAPESMMPEMEMKYSIYSSEMRVLIYDIGADYIPAGRVEILNVPASARLTGAEAATFEGVNVDVSLNAP